LASTYRITLDVGILGEVMKHIPAMAAVGLVFAITAPAHAQKLVPGHYASPPFFGATLSVTTENKDSIMDLNANATRPNCTGSWAVRQVYRIPASYTNEAVDPEIKTCTGHIECNGIILDCGGFHMQIGNVRQHSRSRIGFITMNAERIFDRTFLGASAPSAAPSKPPRFRMVVRRGPGGAKAYVVVRAR
jgi:hypothetical protein